MAKTFHLNDIPQDLLPLVGGKARGLHMLIKHGYTVPDGFIITDINDSDSGPAAWEEAIRRYRDMGSCPVAVRSSATLEDGRDFSAAGQFSTVLNVQGESALMQAIEDCIASLHSVTATNYSRQLLQKAECKMTVVVQRMVSPRCAGVLFSRAPLHKDLILTEAVEGLGENLVSGKVSAQQYLTTTEKVVESPEKPFLTEEELLGIAKAGKQAETLFGMPMDLEWAIDSKGTVQWLQARPITVEETIELNELDCQINGENDVYTLGNIGEVMPGAVTPLNLSTNMLALDWGVKATFAEMNCAELDWPDYKYISAYYNHMFFNMSSMYIASHKTLGMSKAGSDTILCGRELTEYPEAPTKNDPLWKRIRNTIPFIRIVMDGDGARRGMDEAIASIRFDLSQDIPGIYRQIIDNFPRFKRVHYYHYCTSYYSGGATHILLGKLEKHYSDRNKLQALMAGSLTEIEDFESANVLRMMRSLGDAILAEEPAVKQYTAAELSDWMDQKASKAVREQYRLFMERHGHRGIREMEIRSLSWNQDRRSFFTSLRSVIASAAPLVSSVDSSSPFAEKKEGAATSAAAAPKPWTAYADELLSVCSAREKKSLMKQVLKARKGVCYREYTKSKMIFALDQYKQAYRKLAELMTEAGMLPDVDAIYFLKQDEVGRLINGEQALVKKAIARRRMFPQLEQMAFPFVCKGIPQPATAAAGAAEAGSYKGTPVSRGIATGRARVVRNEQDAAQLQQGEIMVANSTDIGWTPYYNTIGGLVTEIGSALSHGIVVAREYALPSIVNVTNVMNEIHTGDIVTIDGNSGTVIINSRAE